MDMVIGLVEVLVVKDGSLTLHPHSLEGVWLLLWQELIVRLGIHIGPPMLFLLLELVEIDLEGILLTVGVEVEL